MRPIRLLATMSSISCATLLASIALAQGPTPPPVPQPPASPPATTPPEPAAPGPIQTPAPAPTQAPVPAPTQAPAPTPNALPVATEPSTPATPPPPPPSPAEPGYDVLGTAGARAVGMAPPGTRPGDFMDTRLSWTFGDDDFLHPTGQLIPLSPTFSVGDRTQYRLFFDNLNSRFNGRENLTHLVMYKKMPGFLPHLTTEAAMVLRFDLAALAANTENLNQALYDSGSYIRLFYNTNEGHPNEGVSAVFFPLDTDRFRLGY